MSQENFEIVRRGNETFKNRHLDAAGSGAAFERDYWGLFGCRDGRVVWRHAFASEAEALEVAGLSE